MATRHKLFIVLSLLFLGGCASSSLSQDEIEQAKRDAILTALSADLDLSEFRVSRAEEDGRVEFSRQGVVKLSKGIGGNGFKLHSRSGHRVVYVVTQIPTAPRYVFFKHRPDVTVWIEHLSDGTAELSVYDDEGFFDAYLISAERVELVSPKRFAEFVLMDKGAATFFDSLGESIKSSEPEAATAIDHSIEPDEHD